MVLILGFLAGFLGSQGVKDILADRTEQGLAFILIAVACILVMSVKLYNEYKENN